MNQLKLKVLFKNRFLYSSLFPCTKAIIYKIHKTLKLHFILNFAILQLGYNLRYLCKYYIAKHLAKFLFTSLTLKTYNWGSKQTKVPKYICAKKYQVHLDSSYTIKELNYSQQKKLYILTNENHKFLATSNTLVASKKELVH